MPKIEDEEFEGLPASDGRQSKPPASGNTGKPSLKIAKVFLPWIMDFHL